MTAEISKPNIKVALVMREFSAHAGGAEKFAANLATGLTRRGMEIEVWGGRLEPGLGLEGCFQRIPFWRKPSSLKVWSFCAGYRKLLQRAPVDVTLGITQVYPVDIYRVGSGVYPHWSAIQCPNPFVRFLYTLIRPVQCVNRGIEKKILLHDRLKKVVVNSEMEKKNLLRYYPVPEGKVEVIYNGVDLERFHPRMQTFRQAVRRDLQTHDHSFVVLFPSNNFGRKGLGVLIHAMAHLKWNDLVLWVAGKGKPALFKSLARTLGVESSVRFLGKRPDIERLYGASDVMILPTKYDSFSNVVLEALAGGIPVITTRDNGASEVVDPGENGFILEDPEDAQALAGLIQKVRERGRGWTGQTRRSAEEFSLEKSVQAYVHLFEELAGGEQRLRAEG